MKKNKSVDFILNLAKTQAMLARRFDASLGGVGLNEFMILYHLASAEDEKLRRIDLADKIGLTASGVTRLLAPMEKIGLIKREQNAMDARVSYVAMASGGKRVFGEAIERAELLVDDLMSSDQKKEAGKLSDLLTAITKNI